MHARPALSVLLLLCALSVPAGLLRADEGGTVSVEEAAKQIGKKVSVRFEVRSAGKDPDSKMVFLNSEKDHKKAGNFVVVLSPEVAVKFKAAGIAAPEKHYLGKTVVVHGTVTKFKSFAQIRVFGPENIKVAGSE